jgi:polysaccharide biosynthesis/export protein
MNRHPSFVFSLALLLATFGVAVHAQNPSARAASNVQAEATPTAANNYRIGPGDVLLIEVAGEPDLKRKAKVTEQGAIRLPYINQDLKLAGLSELQAAQLLNKEFLAILKDPQVTVFIEEYNAQFVGIAGAVKNPKRFPLTRELRVYDLITEGGGLTDKAGDIVLLVHTRGSESIETIDLKELFRNPELNRVIRDGDLLNVPEAGVIYVEGTVNKAGVFPLKENVTLTQAIAMAGGLAQDAKRKEIRLWRAKGSERTEQIANLDEIEKDPRKDILLRPYDIVLVPEATGRKQARSLVQAFAGGLSSALGWGILR